MPVVRRMLLGLTLGLTLGLSLTLAGCVTSGLGTSKAACQVFRPITSSVKDTLQTRKEIVEHNAAGKAACGWRR